MSGGAVDWRRMAPALVALAIAVVYLVWTFEYEGRAHTVPALIGWLAVVLTTIDVIAQTESRIGRYLAALLSGRPLDSSSVVAPERLTVSRQVVACLWPASFVAGVWLAGFFVAIPLFLLAFMRFQGRWPWRRSLITAAVMTVVIWLVFEVFLSYEMFYGVLFGAET